MDKDLDTLQEALSFFAHAFSRPKAWEIIQERARTTIDRPSATLLHALLNTPETSAGNGCKLHELAHALGIEAPSVTRTVQQLEQDKLVHRVADPDDRRAVRLIPTRRGKLVMQRIRQAKRERLRGLLSGWSPHERHQLVTLIHRLSKDAALTTRQPNKEPK